jgi:hypothetical protein
VAPKKRKSSFLTRINQAEESTESSKREILNLLIKRLGNLFSILYAHNLISGGNFCKIDGSAIGHNREARDDAFLEDCNPHASTVQGPTIGECFSDC